MALYFCDCTELRIDMKNRRTQLFLRMLIMWAITKEPSGIIEKTFIQTYTKSEDWTYESEYRLVQNYFPQEPEPFERIINVNDDVFSEVILGINISKSDEKEIVAICRKKKVPVYRAKPKDFLFEIDRDLIK